MNQFSISPSTTFLRSSIMQPTTRFHSSLSLGLWLRYRSRSFTEGGRGIRISIPTHPAFLRAYHHQQHNNNNGFSSHRLEYRNFHHLHQPSESSTGATPESIDHRRHPNPHHRTFTPASLYHPLPHVSQQSTFFQSLSLTPSSVSLPQQLALSALFNQPHNTTRAHRTFTSICPSQVNIPSTPSSTSIHHHERTSVLVGGPVTIPTTESRHFRNPSRHFSSSVTNHDNGIKKPNKSFPQKVTKYFRKYVTRPGTDLAIRSSHQLYTLLKATATSITQLVQHPSIIFTWSDQLKNGIIHGWHWTKRGFGLFGANFRISLLLLQKKIKGQPLNYRDHKLLVRTTSDLIKLVPFSFFVVVPFAELLLPIALWLFPGMLPSTFADKSIDNRGLQRKLKAKQELAQFFQEMVAERTRQVLDKTTSERSRDRAEALKEFQEKLILKAKEESRHEQENGELSPEASELVEVNPFLSLKETLTYAKLFREEFKMEKMPTKALMVLCKMLGLQPYGIRANVILQLRHHILGIQREDREILWEGVDSLTHDELVEACKERAMRFYGVSDEAMRDQMKQWLELSSHKDIPPLLLLWSRSITITHSLAVPEPHKEEEKETLVEAIAQQQPTVEQELSPISAKMESGEQARVETEQRIVVESDELLPVVPSEEKTFEEKIVEEKKEREEELKTKLEEADKRLLELRSEVDILQKEAKVRDEALAGEAKHRETLKEPVDGSILTTDNPDEILRDKAQPLVTEEEEHVHQSRVDRVRAAKEELLRKCEKLESEMSVMRTVSDLQYKQVDIVIKTLAGLIDEYRQQHKVEEELATTTTTTTTSTPSSHDDKTEYFVGRLEELLKTFEEGVSELSEKLESAKCLRLSGDDESFYPTDSDSDTEESSKESLNTVNATQASTDKP